MLFIQLDSHRVDYKDITIKNVGVLIKYAS